MMKNILPIKITESQIFALGKEINPYAAFHYKWNLKEGKVSMNSILSVLFGYLFISESFIVLKN